MDVKLDNSVPTAHRLNSAHGILTEPASGSASIRLRCPPNKPAAGRLLPCHPVA